MSTVAEIREALGKLSTEELRQVEEAVRRQYRTRKDGILYDDSYGMWTENDQISAAAEAFALMDEQEAASIRRVQYSGDARGPESQVYQEDRHVERGTNARSCGSVETLVPDTLVQSSVWLARPEG